jgi:ribosomal protein L37AE/L43A
MKINQNQWKNQTFGASVFNMNYTRTTMLRQFECIIIMFFTKATNIVSHCETCGKTFRRQAYLRKHVLNHANDQQTTRVYSEPQNNNMSNINDCNVCPTNLTLDKSVRVQNNDIYKCKYCASSFFSSPTWTTNRGRNL